MTTRDLLPLVVVALLAGPRVEVRVDVATRAGVLPATRHCVPHPQRGPPSAAHGRRRRGPVPCPINPTKVPNPDQQSARAGVDSDQEHELHAE